MRFSVTAFENLVNLLDRRGFLRHKSGNKRPSMSSGFLGSPLRNVIGGILFVLTVSALAVVAYMAQGWSLGDALYMVVMTIYTVGYGEVRPIETPGLRATTIALMVVGCTGMVFTTGSLIQLITAAQFQQIFGIRRMQKEIDGLDGHVVVCGFGRIGQKLCRELKAARVAFVVIDHDSDRMDAARQSGHCYLQADATDEDALKRVGITRAKALATVLPEDAANVFITLSARALNPGIFIVARGELPSTERKLLQAGANRVVLPARIGAERVAELLLFDDINSIVARMRAGGSDRLAADLRLLGLDMEVIAVEAGSKCDQRTIGEIEKLGAGAFLIVALERRAGGALIQPEQATYVEAGDGLCIVRRPEKASILEELFAAGAA
jgi:trk system potassium uptake protein TrkA/voltage-gated potassium channel